MNDVVEARDTVRVELTDRQKEILSKIWIRRKEIEGEWRMAIQLVGVDPDRILRGDMEKGYLDLKPE